MADDYTPRHARSEPEPAAAPPPSPPAPVTGVEPGYTDSGVPTFDSVREKIETRFGTALGSAELDAETPEGRGISEQYEARQRTAHDKLEEIRASMRKPTDR